MLQPTWMIRRVRQMSMEEVAVKAWVAARDQLDAVRANPVDRHVAMLREGARLLLPRLPDPLPLPAGVVRLHGLDWNLAHDLDWSRGAGEPWPSVPSANLNLRSAEPHGDVRVRWELERLQWLPGLVLHDADRGWRHFEQFCAHNPVGFGTAWTSAMEVALRVVSVVRAAVSGPVPGRLRGDVAGLVVASARYISAHRSSGSSHGNHTLVEALGLLWAGSVVDHPMAQQWRREGLSLVERCALKQIHPDGTPAEQSTGYLAYILDALLHAAMVAPLADEVWSRMEAAASFLIRTSGPSGVPFDLGDRDDGCVGWGTGDRRALAAGVAAAVRAARPREEGWAPTAAACRWAATLGAPRPAPSLVELTTSVEPAVERWADGGMTQLSLGAERVLLRHAPLGLPPLYGHGHQDPLAVLWRIGDIELLGDSGTGAYAGAEDMRAYLRSMAAHNTWRDDRARTPSVRGAFLQAHPYQCVLEEASPEAASATAWLGGTRQRREVRLYPGRLVVLDVPDAPTQATGWWCVGRDEATLQDGLVRVERPEGVLWIRPPAGVTVRLVCGAIGPVEGWRSERYSEWHPSTVVEVRGAMPARGWTTELWWEAR